ncbi:hypothetical protein K439DRAFT_1640429 [Ramaria rubella]|nr:hypothetical protein K439DRAFT_1640429 [Ramaria rubella]
MDDSPPFEVHVQQYISSAKTDKRADSPSPASYLHDIIFHDVATLLESEAARSSIKNSDKHPSTHVMQDPSLALTTVLVPSCSEAGKDSQSLSFNVSVPEGCHVGSSTSNLTEMSDGFTGARGSKPAVTAIEANVAGHEHLRGITALPSNGGGDFTGQHERCVTHQLSCGVER